MPKTITALQDIQWLKESYKTEYSKVCQVCGTNFTGPPIAIRCLSCRRIKSKNPSLPSDDNRSEL